MWATRTLSAQHELLWWLVLFSVATLSMGVFAREARGSARMTNVSVVAVASITGGDSQHG